MFAEGSTELRSGSQTSWEVWNAGMSACTDGFDVAQMPLSNKSFRHVHEGDAASPCGAKGLGDIRKDLVYEN